MPFGKRTASAPTPLRPNAPAVSVVPLTHPVFGERVGLLLADMKRVLSEAAVLAGRINTGELLDASSFNSVFEPESYPINIAAFSRHFNFQRDGRLRHAVFCYLSPDEALDRTAQLHLLELTTAISSFNTLCFDSHQEGALQIAFQSKTARDSVDRAIVLSSYFCGVLDNLIYQNAAATAKAGTKARETDPVRMQRCIDDWSTKAKQAMLAKDRFDFYLPVVPAPILLAETEVADHAGQVVVNQVYLPVELATPVLAKMAATQGRR